MIKKLHQMGVRSGHMYTAGLASIALSFGTWFMSKNTERAGLDRADRWGIFIGEWAPTFFALGVALRIEETHRDMQEGEMGVFEQAESTRSRSHAGV
ncbi:hypothetical protein AB0M50_49520 [Nonomuraea fuscirosea]|jgi:hypothetical protein|uniref:Uncharacterized protein n=1 Tax=Nonomuraea fuscirosea TaxID=1291556 RepID=A0A2T0NAD9_9ACTN|nr:hypothetical protein [Nonomuraea fuscirosea]PRX69978.1 hypothetical protein B0I32_10163 [Nonomuraea fuscirosea]WSA54338.1 hypothetical protein OIE67_06880 [Nonomuraea fuscirosea]